MNAFRKLLLLLLIPVFACIPHLVGYAAEANTNVTDIIALDATIRDANTVNLRKEPNISSDSIAIVSTSEHFTVIDQVGKWFKVNYNDITGYIFWKYVCFSESIIDGKSNLLGNSIINYTSSENRDINMLIACLTINGTVLQPGDEFRWSNIIGQTTEEKGYRKAPVIIHKKYALDLGGGVCQVSTTIYNALLDTHIQPTELHHHSIGSSYSKNDATVAYGSKDFAFINTYDFPIKIEMSTFKGVVFCNIYKV